MKNALMKGAGDLTWQAEGQEGGYYHSRKLHVPSSSSGLTIGRGYDMKEKSKTQIVIDLTAAGVAKDKAEMIANGSGLKGDAAKIFVTEKGLADFEISLMTQEQLFEKTYNEMLRDVKRISHKDDVVERYGKLDFDKVDSRIIDILVDLRYRGDYTPTSRALIQKAAVANDLEKFRKLLSTPANWSNVPKDRFERRVNFLNEPLTPSGTSVPRLFLPSVQRANRNLA